MVLRVDCCFYRDRERGGQRETWGTKKAARHGVRKKHDKLGPSFFGANREITAIL